MRQDQFEEFRNKATNELNESLVTNQKRVEREKFVSYQDGPGDYSLTTGPFNFMSVTPGSSGKTRAHNAATNTGNAFGPAPARNNDAQHDTTTNNLSNMLSKAVI
ncbi:hypothetical protein K7X08_025633 [Anisodus acutangulus]|uniref:Uncharacterized protein n=1 Tax=Anisodus acutangulus TaxID=402998 RepID=A0A9Q1LT13_9SOLA|nr:hypothetical protein K7X08_025633 [Anisodus acutangulus]